MRVTQTMLDRNILFSLGRNLEALAELSEQLSTGLKVNTVSDDVPATRQILLLERENERIDAYVRNQESAQRFLALATSSLQDASETLSRVKELAVQAATGTYSDVQRSTIAENVDGLLGSLFAVANSRAEWGYVFAGEATSTAPFQVTAETSGYMQSITYQGAPASTEVAVGARSVTELNLVGSDAFRNDGDLFGTVIALRDAMWAGDIDEINRLIGELEVAHADVRQSVARLGAQQEHVDVLRGAAEGFKVLNEQFLSDRQDANIAEVAVQYNSMMALLQMVMRLSADVVRPTIFDYL